MIFPHINIKPTRPGNLLQHTPRPWGPPQIIQSPHRLQHSCNRYLADILTKTPVWAGAIVDVRVHGAVERHGFWLGVDYGVAGGGDEAHEDVVACVDGDGAAIVIYGHGFHSFAVDTKSAVHSCAKSAGCNGFGE